MLPRENAREYVVDHDTEGTYLAACPQPLQDAATLMLDTGLRVSEALNLRWTARSCQGDLCGQTKA